MLNCSNFRIKDGIWIKRIFGVTITSERCRLSMIHTVKEKKYLYSIQSSVTIIKYGWSLQLKCAIVIYDRHDYTVIQINKSSMNNQIHSQQKYWMVNVVDLGLQCSCPLPSNQILGSYVEYISLLWADFIYIESSCMKGRQPTI